MERKKRSKGRGWESCYVKKIYGMFGVEMRAYGQKLVKFCTHTHRHTDTRGNLSSIDYSIWALSPGSSSTSHFSAGQRLTPHNRTLEVRPQE